MIEFNLSASALKLYKESPYRFYLKYIAQREPDTEVVDAYGIAGTLVHEFLEDLANGKVRTLDEFKQEWINRGLNDNLGLNNYPLSYQRYEEMLKYGLQVLLAIGDKKIIPEMKIIKPFYETELIKVDLKGFIDLVVVKDEEVNVIDWKTSSKKDPNFEIQAKHYAYLYWKETGKIPETLTFVYLHLKDKTDYHFTEKELRDYEVELLDFVIDISLKSSKDYDLGNCDSPFNEYKKACNQEKLRRKTKDLNKMKNTRPKSLYMKNNIQGDKMLKIEKRKTIEVTPTSKDRWIIRQNALTHADKLRETNQNLTEEEYFNFAEKVENWVFRD